MPHLVVSNERRESAAIVLDIDVAEIAAEAEEVDAALADIVIDLLPLGALVSLSERSRAA